MAREAIHFEKGKSANILRGALGTIFRRLACVPECPGTRACEVRASCPYARLFEPAAVMAGPSGLADWPRPFVFRAMHLDGQTFQPGQGFHVDMNLFETSSASLDYLVRSFAELAREGLGSSRSKVELTAQQNAEPVSIDLDGCSEQVQQLRVRFLTPTELKSGEQLIAQPEFGVLACRARDRISTLRELYGAGPLDIDFRGFGERAALVQMTRCNVRQVDVQRRSSRTGQVHSLGGFVGEAEYEGELAEFVPYLQAAQWTGVGRQTVWGKGAIEVDV